MLSNDRFYIYAHYKKIDNSIFYIGRGQKSRYVATDSRNKYWKNTVNKYGFYAKKIITNLTIDEAIELEELIITELGCKYDNTGNLVNLTKGGDGALNRIATQQTKNKISMANKGKLLGVKKHAELCEKLSKSKKGDLNPNYGKSTWGKGKKYNEEHRKNISLGQLSANLPTRKPVKCLETNQIFKSATEASKFLGMERSTVSKSIRINCKCGGFTWVYI